MIEELQLKNFKCFRDSETFEFSKLNLLTGINGRGKSSLLQAITLLSQSAWKNIFLDKLIFNDDLVELGNFDDIKNSDTPRNENIEFNFKFQFLHAESETMNIEFKENFDDPLQADFAKLKLPTTLGIMQINAGERNKRSEVLIFSEKIKKTHFVSADRLGPVKYVDKVNLPKFLHVGARGEHTINILANSIKNSESIDPRLYRGEDADSVLQQTEEWLGYILEGASIKIKGLERESSVLYMLLNNKSASYSYKPANVGFGYSYILPLIVTGLIAKPGETIIVENPEAHLHPRAQSKIAEFFALVAACGVQVFIESHSEHILNGLRVSVINPNTEINHTDLAIHYFNESFEAYKLQINEKGKIANWPKGFFDQQEIDIADMFRYSR